MGFKINMVIFAIVVFSASFTRCSAEERTETVTKEQAMEIQNVLAINFFHRAREVEVFSKEEVNSHIKTVADQVDSYIEKGEMTEVNGAFVKQSLINYKDKSGSELSEYYRASGNNLQTLLSAGVIIGSAVIIAGIPGTLLLILSRGYLQFFNNRGQLIGLSGIPLIIAGVAIIAIFH